LTFNTVEFPLQIIIGKAFTESGIAESELTVTVVLTQTVELHAPSAFTQ